MPFEFTRPWALAVLAVCLPVLIVFFSRSLSDFPKKQRVVSVVTRGLIVLLIVLSLAGLTWLHEAYEQFILFAIDESLSIGEEARDKVTATLDAVADHVGPHRVTYLPFAREPKLVQESRPDSTGDPNNDDDQESGDARRHLWQQLPPRPVYRPAGIIDSR